MKILIYPDPQLKQRAKPIEEINEDFHDKAEEMLQLMYEAQGIGLAATQVGWPVRLLVKDPTGERVGERVYINPVITHEEGESLEEEGCLSLPGIFGKIVRSERIKVVAYNLQGEKLELEAEGLEARVWQHEIDHLNGILVIDKMTPASSLANSRRLKELEEIYKEGTAKTRSL
ncbi:MAG: peptide deformylase [Candidatus Brocadiales bacterium]